MQNVRRPDCFTGVNQILFCCFKNTDVVVAVLWDLVLKIVESFRVNDTFSAAMFSNES